MNSNILDRVNILFQQSRFKEARDYLEEYLIANPDDENAQYLLAVSFFNQGENNTSRQLLEVLLNKAAENPLYLSLAIDLDIADEKLIAAESKAELLQELEPEDSDVHLLMARVKLAQRKYDSALRNSDQALALNAENIEALNLKILVEGILNKSGVHESIDDALHQAPENPYSIANHAIQLVRDGKIKEGLERSKYALSLDPNNEIAQYAMSEAMKSKFVIYRLFFKYSEFSSKLSGSFSWGLIIGLYLLVRFLVRFAKSNPEYSTFIYPVIYVFIGFFIFTWVMGPLTDLYLFSNPYGRLLLDEDDKTMAKNFGTALALLILFGLTYLFVGGTMIGRLAFVSAMSLIPLGSYLNVKKESNLKITKMLTAGIIICGTLGAILNITVLLGLSILGFIAYQWILNGMLIKENARVFGD